MGMVNQKRIAKNTLLLYIRMGVIMLINLYASRVVLASLGETDYGLYNVIGGIVVMFSFLGSVMNAACGRYYAMELGREDYRALHKVFSVNVIIFFVLSLIILVLAETAGLWFLENKMVIPADRMNAARWVYQISIVSFIASMLAIPFRSIITAKEKMKVYAYCSVVEATLKLGAVLLLARAPFDRLVFYAVLMLVVTIGTSLFYALYCSHFYEECKGRLEWDRPLAREIVSFNGWGIIGSMATIGKNQGVNILLNMFYGPVVNAARGVANQVYVNVFEFLHNYVMAFNPQIVKSYAAGERHDMMKLIFQASKFSYYLLFVIILPLLLELAQVLDIWLVDIPEHAYAFTAILLVSALADAMHDPLYYAIQATGHVKWLNILVGGAQLMIVIVGYIVLKTSTVEPEFMFWLILIFTVIAQVLRIILTKHYLAMSIKEYAAKVLLPTFLVTALAPWLPYLVVRLMPATFLRLCITVVVSIVVVAALIYTVGLNQSERDGLKQFFRKKRNADLK